MLKLPQVDAIVRILPVGDILVAKCSILGSRVQHRGGGFHVQFLSSGQTLVERLNSRVAVTSGQHKGCHQGLKNDKAIEK